MRCLDIMISCGDDDGAAGGAQPGRRREGTPAGARQTASPQPRGGGARHSAQCGQGGETASADSAAKSPPCSRTSTSISRIQELRGIRSSPPFRRMIVLDTNVISALMRAGPDRRLSLGSTDNRVVDLDDLGDGLRAPVRYRDHAARPSTDDPGSSISSAHHRRIIEERDAAVRRCRRRSRGQSMARRRQRGRPGELRDTMIAGIAIARRATLATRNTRHFADLPVPVVNPWAD